MWTDRDCGLITPHSISPLRGAEGESGRGFRRRRSLLILAWVLLSSLTLCSCVDLDSVSKFAKSSSDVGSSFKSLADDTLATCQWAHDFFPPGKTPLDCTRYKDLEPQLTAVNDALCAYIASLGKLAAPTSNTNPFKDVAADLKKADSTISTADQNRATAAGGLTRALAQVVASRYQQRRLEKIIHDTNGPVQDVVAFLSGYAADESAEMITNTGILEAEFCVNNSTSMAEPVAVKLLTIKCADDERSRKAKLEAVKKYQDALQVIAETHAKLSEPQIWNTKELVKYLVPQISKLNAAATTMDKAFK